MIADWKILKDTFLDIRTCVQMYVRNAEADLETLKDVS